MTQVIAAETRPPTSAVGRMPDFLVIGAAKAGTTTLWQYLAAQPGVFMARPKEPEYFAGHYGRDERWYRSLFAAAAAEQVCGEASTNYSCGTPGVDLDIIVDRIGGDLPGARLIYLVRHPVDRAYSFYCEQIKCDQIAGRRQGYGLTFEQYLREDGRCVLGGCYMRIIERYLASFPRESLLVLTLEELQDRPAETLTRVCRHIGVDDAVLPNEPLVANAARRWRRTVARQAALAPLRRLPIIGGLGARLPRPMRNAIYACVRHSPRARAAERQAVPPPMRPETRAQLLDDYRQPNERLARWLGRDLSHWML